MSDIVDIMNYGEAISGSAFEHKVDFSNQILPNEIADRKFSDEIILKDTKTDTKKLCIKNCIFKYLNIKDEDADEIREINFKNCNIKKLRVFQSSILLNFDECNIDTLVIESGNEMKIKIEASDFEIISLEKSSRIRNISITQESTITKLDSKDASIDKILIHSSFVKTVHINHSIGELELAQGAQLERLSIDNKSDLNLFLKGLLKRKKKLSKGNRAQRKIVARHQKQIILAAFNQYDDEHKYQELDMCLVNLRKIDCALKKIDSKNYFQKVLYSTMDFVLGKMFGWGVKISNTLVTASVTILGFAVLYFYFLYIKLEENKGFASIISMSLTSSINRFFNVNEVNPMTILPYFDTVEQIVGIVMLTIITGVLVRKIIK